MSLLLSGKTFSEIMSDSVTNEHLVCPADTIHLVMSCGPVVISINLLSQKLKNEMMLVIYQRFGVTLKVDSAI